MLKYLLVCTLFLTTAAHAQTQGRLNQGKELYTPPWSEDVTTLASSCKNLQEDECALLRRLLGLPRAYWLGITNPPEQDILDLHNILRDAIRERKVPTIVLYSFPSRDCGGEARLNKKITAEDYKKWIAKVATAILYYRMAINIVVEPGGLAEVVSNYSALCAERQKSEVLAERIELIRYIAWNFELYDKQKKRLNPDLRLFVDVGSPRSISNSKEILRTADVLEKILNTAEFDGISVNIGENYSVDESLSWVKTLIGLVRLEVRKKLAVAIDTGRLSTFNFSDPRVELTTIVSVPGDTRSGADSFNFPVLLDYLRQVLAKNAVGEKD